MRKVAAGRPASKKITRPVDFGAVLPRPTDYPSVSPADVAAAARNYRPAVVAWARQCVPACDVEDVVQSVMLAFVEKGATLAPQATAAWLRTATFHKVKQSLARREVPMEAPDVACDAPSPEVTLASREVAEQLHRMIGRVPPSRREIVTRVHGEGLTIAAVAVADGIPESKARRRLSDGTADLRAEVTRERRKEKRRTGGFSSWAVGAALLDLRVWARRGLAAFGAAAAGGALYTLTVPVMPRPPEAVMVAPVVLAEDAPLPDTREPREAPRPVVVVRERTRHDAGRRFRAERFGAP